MSFWKNFFGATAGVLAKAGENPVEDAAA